MVTRVHLLLLALPFVAMAAAAYLGAGSDMSVNFTPAELQGYNYSHNALLDEAEIKRKRRLPLSAGMRGPIRAAGPAVADGDRGAPAEGHVLTSILIGEGERKAVINDRIVREGDSVDGMRVLEIKESRVALRIGGAVKWYRLEEE
ncbi:MAG: hypothetical protein Kow0025_18310 [Thermodesulfovibrionales bacterium]